MVYYINIVDRGLLDNIDFWSVVVWGLKCQEDCHAYFAVVRQGIEV